jgi:CRP/FNR family transcriptional regulator, anaerobic regulatory protein
LQRITFNRLCDLINLDQDECDRFARICSPLAQVERGGIIRAQGEEVEHVYLLAKGWVTSSILLPEGERQIVRVHLPGDVLGTASVVLETAAETLTAVTTAEVHTITIRDYFRLYWEAPRVAAALFLKAQQERVALMDRLTAVGRTSSARRLASLLVHLHDRLGQINQSGDNSFHLPLTQVDLADMLGITPIHMNRVIKTLKSTGFIGLSGSKVTLNDVQRLREFSALPQRDWVRQPAWLREPVSAASSMG